MEELVNRAEKLYQDTGFKVEYDHALHEKYVHENEIEDAIEETEKQTKLEIAKTMLIAGESIEKIMKYTKLSVEEIEKLRHVEK